MKIIGIDPGINALGIAVIDEEKNLIFSKTLKSPKGGKSDKLLFIYKEFSKILREFKPQYASLESVFVDKNPKSAILLGSVLGILYLALKKKKIKTFELSSREIKKLSVGKGDVSREKFIYFLKRIERKSVEDLTVHELDALACAMALLQKIKTNDILRKG